MVIYRVPHAYLNDYQMIGQRVQVLLDMKRRDNEEQKMREQRLVQRASAVGLHIDRYI
jgi:hypothetical protein